MIRRRTTLEKALSRLRRLNDPPKPTAMELRRRVKPTWPERGAIEKLFSEARRLRA